MRRHRVCYNEGCDAPRLDPLPGDRRRGAARGRRPPAGGGPQGGQGQGQEVQEEQGGCLLEEVQEARGRTNEHCATRVAIPVHYHLHGRLHREQEGLRPDEQGEEEEELLQEAVQGGDFTSLHDFFEVLRQIVHQYVR